MNNGHPVVGSRKKKKTHDPFLQASHDSILETIERKGKKMDKQAFNSTWIFITSV